MECFDVLSGTGKVVKRNAPHCALGLIIDGQAICKDIMLFASSILLLAQCKGLKFVRNSHGTLLGHSGTVVKTTIAQVWPRGMCHRNCIGIQAKFRHRRAHLVHDSDASRCRGNVFVYPVDRGRFRETHQVLHPNMELSTFAQRACEGFVNTTQFILGRLNHFYFAYLTGQHLNHWHARFVLMPSRAKILNAQRMLVVDAPEAVRRCIEGLSSNSG